MENTLNHIQVETCSTRIILLKDGEETLIDIDTLDSREQDGCYFYLTLEDISSQLKKMYPDDILIIYVWYEMGLSGSIYCYSSNDKWSEHGTTRGYA